MTSIACVPGPLLPFSLAFALLDLTVRAFPGPGLTSSLAAALPPMILLGWTLRTYAGSLFRVQQFSRIRGCACLVLSMALFLLVVAGGVAVLTLLVRAGAGDYFAIPAAGVAGSDGVVGGPEAPAGRRPGLHRGPGGGLGLYDERPDARRVAEMARPLPPVIDADNAWLAFLGFCAPPGESPIAYGGKAAEQVPGHPGAGPRCCGLVGRGRVALRLEFQGELPCHCGDPEEGRLACAAGHPEEISRLVRDNEELLRRYAQLRGFKSI